MINKIQTNANSYFMVGKVLAYNSVFKTLSIEHYVKCSFRCAYCSSDSQGKSRAVAEPAQLINMLRDDLHEAELIGLFHPKKTKLLVSCHTDAYIDLDGELSLTRSVIDYLIKIEQPFVIVTRGVLIKRDLDLLQKFKDHCEVSFSLPVIDAGYLKKYEPHTPPIEDRIYAIFATHSAGIKTTVRIAPWIPAVTDVEEILECLPEDINVLIAPLALSETFIYNDEVAMGPHQRNDFLFNKYIDFAQNGFCQTATKLFSHLSQAEINNEYIKERNRIGFRQKTKWHYPPAADGSNINEVALRFLKPNEILL